MRGLKVQNSNTLKILNITSDFINDTNVKEAVTYTSVADWEDFFLSSLNRNVLAMVTKPQQFEMADKVVNKQLVTDEELVHILPSNVKLSNNISGMLVFFYSIEIIKITLIQNCIR